MHELAVILVGLLAGSLLIEGLVLVPFWRGLSTKSFNEMHRTVGPRLFAYFSPLTFLAVVGSIGAALVRPTSVGSIVGAACLLAALVIFFAFFRAANAGLSKHTYGDAELAVALRTWALWHHFRTGIVLIGFAALVAA